MKYLAFFLCVLSSLSAFDREIESITYRSQAGATISLIQLNDGSVWKWSPDLYSENLLRRWEVGDRVLIQAINHPGFGLKNLDKPHYTPIVSLSFNSYPLYPTVKKCDNSYGVLELSDGTKWEILYDFNIRTLHHWTTGDRIIAVKGIQDNFELINLDIPHENRGQIERFMEVTPTPSSLCQEPVKEEILSANPQSAIIH
ncbi:MAG: hypothetical protein P0S96_00805 [Simkaniaceae bacterium]|nr:hypothetical protein [Candidatus Sacchlamyda saccharinae]